MKDARIFGELFNSVRERAAVKERRKMISYKPFYKTLLEKNITEYQLIFKHGFSANILYRMKHGETITLRTLDTLCFILNCPVSDIIEYVPDELVQEEMK